MPIVQSSELLIRKKAGNSIMGLYQQGKQKSKSTIMSNKQDTK